MDLKVVVVVVVVVALIKVGKVFQKALKKQRCVVVFPHKVLAIIRGFFRTRREKKEQKNSKKRKSPLFIICFLSAHVFRREGERKEDEKTRPDDDVDDDDDDDDDVCRRFGLSSLAGESFHFFVFGDQTIREKRRDGRIGEE